MIDVLQSIFFQNAGLLKINLNLKKAGRKKAENREKARRMDEKKGQMEAILKMITN